jgi:hypothetical protein
MKYSIINFKYSHKSDSFSERKSMAPICIPHTEVYRILLIFANKMSAREDFNNLDSAYESFKVVVEKYNQLGI